MDGEPRELGGGEAERTREGGGESRGRKKQWPKEAMDHIWHTLGQGAKGRMA